MNSTQRRSYASQTQAKYAKKDAGKCKEQTGKKVKSGVSRCHICSTTACNLTDKKVNISPTPMRQPSFYPVANLCRKKKFDQKIKLFKYSEIEYPTS